MQVDGQTSQCLSFVDDGVGLSAEGLNAAANFKPLPEDTRMLSQYGECAASWSRIARL